MKRILTATVVAMMVMGSVNADQIATTENGRNVMLKDNGTWYYLDTPRTPQEISIRQQNNPSWSSQQPTEGGAKKSEHPDKVFEIIDISTKATESNDIWVRYAWKLTIRNNSSRAVELDGDIKWLDSDGFVIDSDTQYDLIVGATEEKTFTGFALIRQPGAQRVYSISAELKAQ